MKNQVSISVPATTANLGPGFDCIGAALNWHNHFRFRAVESGLNIRYRGTDHVSLGKDNLVYRAFCRAFEVVEAAIPPVEIELDLNVPLSRGLGSSATAIVGGLLGANALGELNLAPETLLQLAIAIEGHPDNVVPALKGNCQLCVQSQQGQWVFCPIDWDPSVHFVVVVPDFKLSTQTARDVLPKQISVPDAVFTAGHLGLLIQALQQGNGDWLKVALQDRLHQPARQDLISGFKTVQAAAQAMGAHGVVISGAGPTLLAFCDQGSQQVVADGMVAAWAQLDIQAEAQLLTVDKRGGYVMDETVESAT